MGDDWPCQHANDHAANAKLVEHLLETPVPGDQLVIVGDYAASFRPKFPGLE